MYNKLLKIKLLAKKEGAKITEQVTEELMQEVYNEEMALHRWAKERSLGKTCQEIADREGVSKQAVSEALVKAGWNKKTKWSWLYKDFTDLYNHPRELQRMSIKEIAEKYNTTPSTVRRGLLKEGVEIRRQGRKKIK